MNIALFGGSFNPIHTDHINIAKYLYENKKFDEIWLIPTKNHPFKKDINISDKNRIDMINIAIKNFKYIKCNLIEINNKNKISYSYETLKKLSNKYKEFNFSWIIGSDNINEINKWNNIEKLSNDYNIISFNRKNTILNNKNIEKYNIKILDIETIGISSTMIRNGINITKQIPVITKYINDNMLYIKNRLRFHLPEKRVIHSINVGNMAKKLAIKYNINPKKAQIAGFLHDITKYWSNEKHKKYIKKYCKEYLSEPIPTLHSYSGYSYVKYDLLYSNDICESIKKHTTADTEMSKLDKIIFIADKISIERKYEDVDILRKESFEDLNKAFIKILKNQFLNAKKKSNGKIGEQIKKSYNKWVKRN